MTKKQLRAEKALSTGFRDQIFTLLETQEITYAELAKRLGSVAVGLSGLGAVGHSALWGTSRTLPPGKPAGITLRTMVRLADAVGCDVAVMVLPRD